MALELLNNFETHFHRCYLPSFIPLRGTQHFPRISQEHHQLQAQVLPHSESQFAERILNLGNSKYFSCDH